MEVAEIALVGHSMGGLLARSACHYAGPGSWRERVRHLVMLGTPHHGIPLELAAGAVHGAVSRLPETRALVKPLKLRSAGVRDLGRGYAADKDWHGTSPDVLRPRTGTTIPFLPGANHYFVSATLSREPDAPLGRLVGDVFVLPASAWSHPGRGRRMEFSVDQYRHVGGANHLDLLNHPAVYDQIRLWLAGGRALPAPLRALPTPPRLRPAPGEPAQRP